MNHLPKVESNCGRITHLFYQAISSRLLMTAIHLNVFDYLEAPATAGELASALASHPGNTMHMLDALCACELVKKNGETYKNTSEASELLLTGKPAYLGEWLKQADEDCSVCLEKLPELILSGPDALPQKQHMNSEEYCERFTVNYSANEVDAVLNKCHAALNPGGFFVGIHAVLTHARTQPSSMVVGMLPDAVSDQGVLPDKGFLEHALERCAFRNTTSKMISVGGMPMEMNVGYVNKKYQ